MEKKKKKCKGFWEFMGRSGLGKQTIFFGPYSALGSWCKALYKYGIIIIIIIIITMFI